MSGQPIQLLLADPGDGAKVVRQLAGQPFSWVFLGQEIDEFYRVKVAFEGRGNYLDTNCQFQRTAEKLVERLLGETTKRL